MARACLTVALGMAISVVGACAGASSTPPGVRPPSTNPVAIAGAATATQAPTTVATVWSG